MARFLDLEEQRIHQEYEIIQVDKQMAEVQLKEKEAGEKEQTQLNKYGIIPDAKVTVSICNARGLPPNDSYVVSVLLGEYEGKTNVKQGEGPIWNQAIQFPVEDPSIKLEVQLQAVSTGEEVFTHYFDLQEFLQRVNDDEYDRQPQDEFTV